MVARTLQTSDSLENLFEYESFLSILRYYVDLNCFVIREDPKNGVLDWLAVHYHHRPASLFDWQKKYGYVFHFENLNDPDFEARRGKDQPLLLDVVGFHDIFVPIRRKGKRLGTLLSGAFAAHELTASHLRESWMLLTGKRAFSENTEFRQFSQVMLETPVLEGPVLIAYREAMELFARVLTHEASFKVSARLKELLTKVFSKQFAHSYWMDWALGLPTMQATPLWKRDLTQMEWIRSDIGISRFPTTVITAMPLNVFGKKRDVIEEMVRIYRFQRRSFSFAQKIPQTYGGKLENYGVVFVTSADPTLSRPQRRMQVKEIAERIQRFAMEELGGPVLVGIGETVVSGEPLNESYRQAVLALHLGRESGKNMIWYGPIGNEKSEGISAILRLLGELRKRLESASYSGLEAVVDEFLEQVLISSLRNPEEIRRHLQYGLIQLLEAVKGRGDLSEGEASDFQGNLIRSLEKAGTTQEMVLAFKDSFERLISLTSGKGTLQAAYSIQKVRDYAADHFREQLKMTRLAKLAGVSVATLSRHFKKATGVGFEIYLQNLRLEEARRLLKTGSLPVAQVARACGFKAGSHFARFFRKKTGFSPQQFRDKSQRL